MRLGLQPAPSPEEALQIIDQGISTGQMRPVWEMVEEHSQYSQMLADRLAQRSGMPGIPGPVVPPQSGVHQI